MAAVKVARLFLCFSNRWQVGPPVALLFLLLAAGVECRPSAPDPCMRRSVPSQSCSRFVQVPIGGPAAECVRPVVTGCDRAGPRAPARQMVVRITLCTCPEGREGTENQPNPGFPRNPSLAPQPLLSTVCSIFSDEQGQEDVPVRGTLGREGRAPRLTINLALLYPDVV
jgi:hypothetical protein